MAILYKYYSYLPPEFFDEPTLKITSPIHLNDPFESLLPSDIKEYIQELIESNEINHTQYTQYTKEQMIKSLTQTMQLNGVISFSETQRNLLMWAHYADDHKGLCIGYETDEILFSDTKKRLKSFSGIRKVNYDTVRHEHFGEIEKIKDPAYLHHYIVSNVMLTKGDSWIYEKEHRFIIPTNKADYIKLKRDDLTKNKNLNLSVEKMIEIDAIKISSSHENESEYITYVPTDSEAAAGSGYLNEHKQAAYYLKVNPKSIRKIYFGCRANDDYIEKINEAISKNSDIHDELYINKMQLDNKRFELFIPPLKSL
ncbi:DUF2971 domain-containing protein [Aeromonas piscicola]|uniref:DUF2971 domain-containing protein n=1 Tax=Aeromonas piscicola TaxID=600645 RepID=UPI0028EF249F|nr:DUF2971 domain-containing protein [Aeromonas piscicola]